MNRETIYGALHSRLTTKLLIPGHINLLSRKFRTYSDLSPPEFPGLIMCAESETAQTEPNMPTKWLVRLDLFLYVSVKDDPSKSASEKMNPVLDLIEQACNGIDNFAENRNTLGGVVRHCRIDGAIKIDETINGDTAIAVIPIEILTA